ncbi:DNA replication complex GINS protein PSF2-like isoform X1 [Zingiber officinale]|nr:DNA replication complex GINS protein PSF2-like isoform X1 [Zingiber officinale]
MSSVNPTSSARRLKPLSLASMAGQSDPQLSLLSAPEVEFLAEDEMVEIVPNIKMESLNMIWRFWPFLSANCLQSTTLASSSSEEAWEVHHPHTRVDVDKLTQVLETERETPREFQPLPFHYIEISKLLFDHAHDDVQDTYMVRSLIEDIRDVRFHKVESGLENISGRTHAVKLKNLSAMEVNIVRPFMMRTLQAFYKHDNPQIIQQHNISGRKQPQVLTRSTRNLRPR